MACPYCGHDHDFQRCERVTAIEYAADGTVLKVEGNIAPKTVTAADKPRLGVRTGALIRGI